MKVDQYTRQVVPESSRALSAAEATVAPVEMAGNINYAGTMAEMGRSADGLGAAVIGLMEKRQEEKDKLALTNFSGEAEAAYIDFVPSMDEKKDAENLQLRRAKLENYLAKDQTMSGEMRKLLQARIMAQDRIQQTKATARRNIMIRDQNVSNAHQTMKLAMQNGEVDKAEKVRNILLSDYPEQAAKLNLPDDDELQDRTMVNNLSIAATQKDSAGLRQSSEYLTNLLKQPGDSFEFDYDGRAVKVKRQSLYKLRNLYRELERNNSAENYSRLNDELAAGKLTAPDLKKQYDAGEIDTGTFRAMNQELQHKNYGGMQAELETGGDDAAFRDAYAGEIAAARERGEISVEQATNLTKIVKTKDAQSRHMAMEAVRRQEAERKAKAVEVAGDFRIRMVDFEWSVDQVERQSQYTREKLRIAHDNTLMQSEKAPLLEQLSKKYQETGKPGGGYKNSYAYKYAHAKLDEMKGDLYGVDYSSRGGFFWKNDYTRITDAATKKSNYELFKVKVDEFILGNPNAKQAEIDEFLKTTKDTINKTDVTKMLDTVFGNAAPAQNAEKAKAQPQATKKILRQGDVVEGYRFKGGANIPENWEKIETRNQEPEPSLRIKNTAAKMFGLDEKHD